MDVAEAVELIRTQHHAVLATERSDGRPQLSPVSAGVIGDTVVISSREAAIR